MYETPIFLNILCYCHSYTGTPSGPKYCSPWSPRITHSVRPHTNPLLCSLDLFTFYTHARTHTHTHAQTHTQTPPPHTHTHTRKHTHNPPPHTHTHANTHTTPPPPQHTYIYGCRPALMCKNRPRKINKFSILYTTSTNSSWSY